MTNQKGFSGIIVIILTILVAIGVGGYLIIKDKKTQLTGFISNAITTDWKTYKNNRYGFLLKYPAKSYVSYGIEGSDENYEGYDEWEYKDLAGDENTILFGPRSSKSGGYWWGVSIFSSANDLEEHIKVTGSQFSDRKEKMVRITINSLPATIATITTEEFDGWVSNIVYLEKDGFIYSFSNNSDLNLDKEFQLFYNSLGFF